MNNIKAGDKKPLQEAIISRCNVSLMAYRKWIRGLTMPRPKNQTIINIVANEFGYDVVYLSDLDSSK